jgi:hypothetical protein
MPCSLVASQHAASVLLCSITCLQEPTTYLVSKPKETEPVHTLTPATDALILPHRLFALLYPQMCYMDFSVMSCLLYSLPVLLSLIIFPSTIYLSVQIMKLSVSVANSTEDSSSREVIIHLATQNFPPFSGLAIFVSTEVNLWSSGVSWALHLPCSQELIFGPQAYPGPCYCRVRRS